MVCARPWLGWKDGVECVVMWLGAECTGACIDAAVPWGSGEGESLEVSGAATASAFGACMDSDKPLLGGASTSTVGSGVWTGTGGFRGGRLASASIASTGLAGREGCRGRLAGFGEGTLVAVICSAAGLGTGAAGMEGFATVSVFFFSICFLEPVGGAFSATGRSFTLFF